MRPMGLDYPGCGQENISLRAINLDNLVKMIFEQLSQYELLPHIEEG